jgi:hypothetical protein
VGHVCSLDFKPENLSFPTEANRGRFLAHWFSNSTNISFSSAVSCFSS